MPSTLQEPLQDPQLDRLRTELRATRDTLAETLATIPESARGARPAADRWSIAEVLEHLAIVETRIGQLLAALVDAAPARDPGTSLEPAACQVDRAMMLDRSWRFTAPTMVQPAGGLDPAEAWTRLAAARDEFESLLQRLDGRALEQVSRPHPALGPLNGYQWISSVVGHEARHTLQIREIAEAVPEQVAR